jgi:cytochrome P450
MKEENKISNNIPAGPFVPPFIQTIQRITHPMSFLEYCARRYGDPFAVRGEQMPAVYFSHPQALQKLFAADPELFHSVGSRTLRPLLGEDSIAGTSGKHHQHLRRLLSSSFHGTHLFTYSDFIVKTTLRVSSRWTPGQSFLLYEAMKEISLRVILHVVFGLEEGELFERLYHLLTALLDHTLDTPMKVFLFRTFRRKLGPWHPQARFLRLIKESDELLYGEITRRRAHLDSTCQDTLSSLLTACDEAGEPLSDTMIRDQLMTLALAGREPTAAAMTWAVYWSIYFPDIEARLLREFATLNAPDDYEAITRLPYLSSVCQEALRFYPTDLVALTRIVKEPIEIMGYTFEAGTSLLPCLYLTHRREDLYPDALRFNPDRFLDRHYSAYEFVPFGGGIHRCLGINFAPFEIKLVLFTVLSRFALALQKKRMARPVSHGPTMGPSNRLRMVVLRTRLQAPEAPSSIE